jgi:hypothetical protein
MLLLTEIPTAAEREAALAEVPWHPQVRQHAGRLAGLMRNQSIDLIDASLGPGHARAALVALQEGADALFQATIDIAESHVREQVLERVVPRDPLGLGEELAAPESPERMRFRMTRIAVEDAAVRAVAGVDHLANAHLRLAWEANAATEADMAACRFNPDSPEPRMWSSVEDLRQGMAKLDSGITGVFSAFVLNDTFRAFADNAATPRLRTYRNEIVHRARPAYLEAPSFGRSSLWAQQKFTITYPPPEGASDHLPRLSDARTWVGEGIEAAMDWLDSLHSLAWRWLGTVGTSVSVPPEGGIKITTEQGAYQPYPRAGRDPGPFLKGAPG